MLLSFRWQTCTRKGRVYTLTYSDLQRACVSEITSNLVDKIVEIEYLKPFSCSPPIHADVYIPTCIHTLIQ